jgi:hypothetical protein
MGAAPQSSQFMGVGAGTMPWGVLSLSSWFIAKAVCSPTRVEVRREQVRRSEKRIITVTSLTKKQTKINFFNYLFKDVVNHCMNVNVLL